MENRGKTIEMKYMHIAEGGESRLSRAFDLLFEEIFQLTKVNNLDTKISQSLMISA